MEGGLDLIEMFQTMSRVRNRRRGDSVHHVVLVGGRGD